MSVKYYISVAGNSEGPYSPEEILTRIQKQQSTWTDYIYDEAKAEWIMLLEHPSFSGKVNSSPKPEAPPPKEPAAATPVLEEAKAWFILKDGNNFGPFSKIEIVKMLQSRQLLEFDFIWHDKFTAWQRVSECDDFKPEAIKELKDSGLAEVTEIFFRRRHARMKYGCSLIVHDNKAVYKGKSLEISAGGAGVIIESSNFDVGTTLFLHFKPGDGVPPFNAICEIVNKSQLRNIPHGPTTPVKYGVKFTNISQEAKETITTYTKAA